MTERARNMGGMLSRRSFVTSTALGGTGLMLFGASACKSSGSSRIVKLGFVTPKTGALAPFAAPDEFVIGQLKSLFDKGIAIDGKTYPVAVYLRDSQSNSKRAAEVAQDLIDNEHVDVLLAAGTADTTNPTADQAEAASVPCITTDTPWEAWFFGRHGDPANPFEWTYHFFWGLDQIAAVYTGMWKQAQTNRVIGSLWSNDPDGAAIRKGVSASVAATGGFKLLDAGLFAPGTTDFTAQISQFKQAGVEIVTGLFIPPDFATFWTQVAQQNFHPKIVTVAKALLFPATAKALGDRGYGLTNELWWSPFHPFKSGLTGQSATELCEAYSQATHDQWVPPLGFKHALFEVCLDVLKRAKALKAEAIRDAIRETNYQSIAGRVSWKDGPTANISQTPLVGGQWVAGGPFGITENVVYNREAPEIPLNAKLGLLS